jgi:predicted esterase
VTVAALDFIHHYQPATAPGAPTLLLLHGTGGNEEDLLPLAPELLPGAGILSPRGKVLEHGMPRFFRRLAEGVFDLDDLRARTAELAEFVAAAAAHYRFDAARVSAVGFSNGANIAGSLLLLRPGVLERAVLFRAMVPLVPDPGRGDPAAVAPEARRRSSPALADVAGERGPERAAVQTPVLISNGRADPLIAPAETERLVAVLRDAGADVTVAWQNAGHHLVPEDLDRAREFLAKA